MGQRSRNESPCPSDLRGPRDGVLHPPTPRIRQTGSAWGHAGPSRPVTARHGPSWPVTARHGTSRPSVESACLTGNPWAASHSRRSPEGDGPWLETGPGTPPSGDERTVTPCLTCSALNLCLPHSCLQGSGGHLGVSVADAMGVGWPRESWAAPGGCPAWGWGGAGSVGTYLVLSLPVQCLF